MLGPDLPLRVALAVGVLAVDDAHPLAAGESEQGADRRDRPLGVRNAQAAAVADEVVLHVDDDQRRPRGIDANRVLDLVLGDLDRSAHACQCPAAWPPSMCRISPVTNVARSR